MGLWEIPTTYFIGTYLATAGMKFFTGKADMRYSYYSSYWNRTETAWDFKVLLTIFCWPAVVPFWLLTGGHVWAAKYTPTLEDVKKKIQLKAEEKKKLSGPPLVDTLEEKFKSLK